MIANAYARASVRTPRLFAALAASVRSRVGELNSQDVANISNAFAKLEVPEAQELRPLSTNIPVLSRVFPLKTMQIVSYLFGVIDDFTVRVVWMCKP